MKKRVELPFYLSLLYFFYVIVWYLIAAEIMSHWLCDSSKLELSAVIIRSVQRITIFTFSLFLVSSQNELRSSSQLGYSAFICVDL